MQTSSIEIVERFLWLMNQKEFKISDYTRKFGVCSRTAKRDIAQLRLFRDYNVIYAAGTNTYRVTRDGTYIG